MEKLENYSKKRVLVHLHVFYYEQLDGFLKKLDKINDIVELELYVTVNDEVYQKYDIENKVKSVFNDAVILCVSNRGYDIGPFISVLHHCDLDNVDYVLKLHTKSRGDKGKTLLNDIVISNSIWEDVMVDSLIGSRDRFSDTLVAMDQKLTGMAAASMCLIRDDSSRLNYYFCRVNDELRRMGLNELSDPESFHFAAGTMFMIKARLLKPLLKYEINDFGINYPGIHDCTLAHTFERLFSGLVQSQGYEIHGLKSKPYKAELKKLEQKRIREEKKNQGDSFFDDASLYLTKLASKIKYRIAKEKVIERSEYFNRNWYRWRYLKKDNIEMNPAEHYLKYGYVKGYEPSPLFNGNQYTAYYPDLRIKKINPLLHYECYGQYEHRLVFNNSLKWNANIDALKESEYFDEKWYLENNPDVKESDVDPVLHYFLHGGFEGRDPSPSFCSNEYLELNQDVKATGINPLCHFEQYGKSQGRKIFFSEVDRKLTYEEKMKTIERQFTFYPVNKKRTAIISVKVRENRLDDSLLLLIDGIRDVADNVIVIGDDLIEENEAERLKGLVSYCCFRKHNMRNFGNFRIGYEYARKEGLLEVDKVNELIMMDDSFYGPVFPFSESFDDMEELEWDYWNYTNNIINDTWNIDSSFCVFNQKILESHLLDEFVCRIKERDDRTNVDPIMESILSSVLESQNMVSESFVSKKDQKKIGYDNPLILLKGYRVPLVRKNVLLKDDEETQKIMEVIRENHSEILQNIKNKKILERERFDIERYQNRLKENRKRIIEKVKRKERVNVAFLVFNASMFSARPLFDLMKDDPFFDPRIIVIPDTRFGDVDDNEMDRCEKELLDMYDHKFITRVKPDYYGLWPEMLSDQDIVSYPSPYNASVYKYNVRYATEQSFLPIIVNYGFSSTKYDSELHSLYNFVYYWKVFMENEETYDEYRNTSVLKGQNADLIGYIKMDSLYHVKRKERERKRILIALHHSIDEGFNDSLSLANFMRYHKYFLSLPDRYPDLDFVFRPHPYLRKALERNIGWGKKKLNKYIEKIKKKPNAFWIETGDYFREFADSDGCIQDCGSFLVEYMYTKKPCCYMLKKPDDREKKFSELGKRCLDRCYISYKQEDIDTFLNEVIMKGNDHLKEERDRFCKNIMINYPYASQKAIEMIKSELSETKQ